MTENDTTSKTNFIEYLDSFKKMHTLDYFTMANLLHLANINFIENKYYDPHFSGQMNPMQPYYYTPKHATQSTTTPLKDHYELWKSKHEVNTLYEVSAIPPVPKTKNVIIDANIQNIQDILHIIENHPYSEDTEYNIDIKGLTNIKSELEQLNTMIGMKELKSSVVDQLIYFMQDLHISNGNSDYKHTVLCGPPGTGKTEIAKIIGAMYSKIGILKNNVFKKVTRNDMVAGYLGQTAIKTKKVIQECIGGVLFIDEAYALGNHYDEDIYSKECIDTLCEALSDHRNDLMVIIAGYEDELAKSFFKANRGMESRFIWRFKIDKYSPGEMLQILQKLVKENEWQLDPSITEKWIEQKKADFPNYGRDMELLFSFTKIAHARRIYGKPDEIRKMITLGDLNKGYDTFIQNQKKEENKTLKILQSMYT